MRDGRQAAARGTNCDPVALIAVCFAEAAADPAVWPSALGALADVLGARAIFVIHHDYATGGGYIVHSAGLQPAFHGRYFDIASAASCPWLEPDQIWCAVGCVRRAEEVVSAEMLARTAFYHDWLEPQGLHHALLGLLERSGDKACWLVAARERGVRAFGAREQALLEHILPAVGGAVRAWLNVRALNRALAGTRTVLDRLAIGVMLVDHRGEVIEANRSATDFLSDLRGPGRASDGDGAGIEGQQIQALLNAHGHDFDITRATAEVLVAEVPGEGERRVSVIVEPLDHGGGDDRERGLPAAAVFLSDPERQRPVDHDSLGRLYKLTPAESRITSLLLQGRRLKEAAVDCRISYQTARTHLKRVFNKTGATRQADLVRLLMSGAAQVAHRDHGGNGGGGIDDPYPW
jgi:DNA-binding CsgD family transcriptional regulator